MKVPRCVDLDRLAVRHRLPETSPNGKFPPTVDLSGATQTIQVSIRGRDLAELLERRYKHRSRIRNSPRPTARDRLGRAFLLAAILRWEFITDKSIVHYCPGRA
jgi:hypothetical protein